MSPARNRRASVPTESRIPDQERKEFLDEAEQFCRWLLDKYEFVLAQAEVKANEHRQLLALEKLGTGTMKKVASAFDRDEGHAGRVVAGLEKKGWVKVSEEEGDGRKKLVELTETGKEMLARCRQQKEEVMARLVCQKNQKTREWMLKALKQLNGLTKGWQMTLAECQMIARQELVRKAEERERRRRRKETRLVRRPKGQPAILSGDATVDVNGPEEQEKKSGALQ